MSIAERIARFFAIEPAQPVTTRSIDPLTDFETQLAAIRRDTVTQPWHLPSISEALSVPAIFRAVTLISNTVGTLSLEAYRLGSRVPQADTPRLIIRPNPFTTPFEFFRDTSYSLASRGEAWWWVASRDTDGSAMSLYPMPAQEVQVQQNDRDLLRPLITWRGVEMRNEDVVQIIQTREPGELRGYGALQRCQAAISVAVEAQDWAANFFADGAPSILIKSAVSLTEQEAQALKTQWYATPSNVPRVIDPSVEDVKDFAIDPAKAQLTDTRRYSKGEAALMFGIPGSLMDYAEPGSSLTYANVSQVYDQFLKACLLPYYLNPIEQAISDLLTRSTTAKFNVDGLLRADIKTRFEVYTAGTASGVLTVEEARIAEGLAPGNVENAPVPLSPPAAYPSRLPIQGRSDDGVRCPKCRKLLMRHGSLLSGQEMDCPRCKTTVVGEAEVGQREAPVVVNVTAPITIEAGAITSPSYISSPDVQVDARTTIEDGAVRLDNHQPSNSVTVKAATQLSDMVAGEEINARLSALEERLARPRIVDKIVLRGDDGRITGVRETELVPEPEPETVADLIEEAE